MTEISSIARLARIQIHPIKSLDPVEVKEARIGPGGGLIRQSFRNSASVFAELA